MNSCKKCIHDGICYMQRDSVTKCSDFCNVKNYLYNLFTRLKPCICKVMIAGTEVEAEYMKCVYCGKYYNTTEAHDVVYCSRCGREVEK